MATGADTPAVRPWCVALAWAVVLAGAVSCAPARASLTPDFGIPACGPEAEADLLATAALQCWLDGRHAPWRVLGQQSHLQALVVEAHARDRRDALAIARRLVTSPGAASFDEVLVYVRGDDTAERREVQAGAALSAAGRDTPVTRVRWARGAGFTTVEFRMPAGDSPLRPQVR